MQIRKAAAAELARREAARSGLIGFTLYVMPGYRPGRMHRLICEKLEAVERGEIKRLMVFTPPRHGKSTLVSKMFPAWYLARNPARQIISASYGADLAADFGREVRNIVASPEYRALFPGLGLAADSKAKGRWHTSLGGSYVSAGVGSAITGRGADILNIDDPLKDREEADSEVIREKVWAWYTSTAYTRLMPGGSVVLTMTRWHQSDLAGMLLDAQQTGGDKWDVINLPAVNEDGSALWPEAYDRAALDQIRATIGPRDWSALYDQDPRPMEGLLFHPEKISVIPAIPAGGIWVRAWDLAATVDAGDWTAGLKLGRYPDGRFVIGDMVRLRGGPADVRAAIVNTAAQDGRSVSIGLPQDPGQAGKVQAADFVAALAGYRVQVTPETGDKTTRAGPVASQVEVGNVSMLQAAWNRPLLEEMRDFPAGRNDDQVDALSRAFGMLIAPAAPAHRLHVPLMGR